jgi:hypothetical protein
MNNAMTGTPQPSNPSADASLRPVWIALILITAVIAGTFAGLLAFASGAHLAIAVLVGGGAFAGTVMLLVRYLTSGQASSPNKGVRSIARRSHEMAKDSERSSPAVKASKIFAGPSHARRCCGTDIYEGGIAAGADTRSSIRRSLSRAVNVVRDELAKFTEPMLIAPLEITPVEGQQILLFSPHDAHPASSPSFRPQATPRWQPTEAPQADPPSVVRHRSAVCSITSRWMTDSPCGDNGIDNNPAGLSSALDNSVSGQVVNPRSQPLTEGRRGTICGAHAELALAPLGKCTTDYAKDASLSASRSPASYHLVGKQPTPRSLVWHTVFFEYRQFAQRWRKGQSLMRKVV